MKSRRMRWAGHVTHIVVGVECMQGFGGKNVEWYNQEDLRLGWEDNTI
jgi:hypothetical protein